jgi:hypothetical protein
MLIQSPVVFISTLYCTELAPPSETGLIQLSTIEFFEVALMVRPLASEGGTTADLPLIIELNFVVPVSVTERTLMKATSPPDKLETVKDSAEALARVKAFWLALRYSTW